MIAGVSTRHTASSLARALGHLEGVALVRAGGLDTEGFLTYVTARPALRFKSFGTHCELHRGRSLEVFEAMPWEFLGRLARMVLAQASEPGSRLPIGGLFGFWGYELRTFVEPRLRSSRAGALAPNIPDCDVGFYSSLAAFDERSGRAYVISSGLDGEGRYSRASEEKELEWWRMVLEDELEVRSSKSEGRIPVGTQSLPQRLHSNVSREDFIRSVERAQAYIQQGDIYQVNLSHRLQARAEVDASALFEGMLEVSPAPCAAFYDGGDYQVASASPELFLRMSGKQVWTRPIKGTRPRSADKQEDTRLAYELQASAKERAELVMITDLMRNDLGRVCEYGSVEVSDLLKLEKFSHVQHLVSTVKGRLRDEMSHLGALAGMFPGGSVTGAPKVRAMEIIEELEPVTRGPYTGAIGFLGANQESQLNMIIRTAICSAGNCWFNVGAGIVADSDPAAEWEETLVKARGFAQALGAGLSMA